MIKGGRTLGKVSHAVDALASTRCDEIGPTIRNHKMVLATDLLFE